MSDTEEHLRKAIRYLTPENGLLSIDKARSEIRDALCHYKIEQETKRLTNANQTQ